MTTIVPANVGIIANARNQKAAEAFVEFLLSDEGQQILLDPKIQRLPVRLATYDKAPAGYPNPFKDTQLGAKVTFNSELSEGRYELLNSLYDRVVTFRLKELNAAWKAIHDAEAQARRARQRGSQAAASPRRASSRRRVPITEKEASDQAIAGAFQALKPGAEARRPAGRVREPLGRRRGEELRRGEGAGREGADGEVDAVIAPAAERSVGARTVCDAADPIAGAFTRRTCGDIIDARWLPLRDDQPSRFAARSRSATARARRRSSRSSVVALFLLAFLIVPLAARDRGRLHRTRRRLHPRPFRRLLRNRACCARRSGIRSTSPP